MSEINSPSSVQFGDSLTRFQAQYGAKAERPREVKKTLDKDDFLKIMVTQMKNQDPLNPFKSEQMGTQIAQFTSVEQLQNANQNLGKIASQNRPLEQLAMTNLIGKVVTVDRERFPHVEGQNDLLSFHLTQDAKTLEAVLLSETGEEVYKKDLGETKAGPVTFSWDGIKSNSLPAKTGNYLMRITAKNDRDASIEVNPRVQARVIGVSFEGSEPVFLVGTAEHQEKVTLKNLAKIEMDLGGSDLKAQKLPQINSAPVGGLPQSEALAGAGKEGT
ncbi:MAG: flagellar hook assembly protein FlgD [Bdellovibrionia bacterium]